MDELGNHNGSEQDRRLHLSIVIPIYNEEESIPHLLQRLRSALNPSSLRYEIIAVDDGSRDNSAGYSQALWRRLRN
jgi:cellulose synthase/poly-beta-1,6-N-acetylglucosamine synthase-like glycosyltransferase